MRKIRKSPLWEINAFPETIANKAICLSIELLIVELIFGRELKSECVFNFILQLAVCHAEAKIILLILNPSLIKDQENAIPGLE
jgi:hypothetical protein